MRLQEQVATLAEQYVASWDKLGPIAAGKEFFRVEYTDFDDRGSTEDGLDDLDDFDDEDRQEFMNIVCLSTLPAPVATSRTRRSTQGQAPRGFEMVVKRLMFEDNDDWREEDEEPSILFRKEYLVR